MFRYAVGAAALTLVIAFAEPAAAQRVRAGVLTCDISAGTETAEGRRRHFAIGGVGGLAGGLLGVGGGFVMVPLQILWARTPPHRASGNSLAAIVPIGALTVGPIEGELLAFYEALFVVCAFAGAITAGNIRTALLVLDLAVKKDCFDRFLIATDTPTGTGVMPQGMIKSIAEMSCLSRHPPEWMIAAATGNPAKIYRLNSGFLHPGRDADVLLIDAPLGGSKRTALEALAMGLVDRPA